MGKFAEASQLAIVREVLKFLTLLTSVTLVAVMSTIVCLHVLRAVFPFTTVYAAIAVTLSFIFDVAAGVAAIRVSFPTDAASE